MDVALRGMRAIAHASLRGIAMHVEGRENIPDGPAIIACRHFHHLYDGAALLIATQRPVRIVVALDWVDDARSRFAMETLCRFGRWPVVLRNPARNAPWGGGYSTGERGPFARRALAGIDDTLRRGELLAIFPQGYPAIDPKAEGRRRADWLPFSPGYLTIAERARRYGLQVPVVPAGLAYDFGDDPEKAIGVTLRFGAASQLEVPADRRRLAPYIEAQVRALSARDGVSD